MTLDPAPLMRSRVHYDIHISEDEFILFQVGTGEWVPSPALVLPVALYLG
eukprot:CAMPEP_0185206804 /NCGR_PEP_ID=MMETSP1140-20130426/59101_1 /TAXON_ID=298111 /ORGANISM="Pavlova sp., Strain CCMP459" /LENGTH=49 /DNA_ID=CAMNT_0027774459 /DNA_START=507 /DNA_END=656 /DNA_ORIENTATION=-